MSESSRPTGREYFILFVIYSFIGCIYEDILSMLRLYLRKGIIKFVTRRGLLYFELSPIYGLGAIIMIYFLTRKDYSKGQYFCLGALIGGSFEYLISFLQETFTGTTSWNYSHKLLNIGGRTTLIYMLFWGLLCYLLTVYIYPYTLSFIRQIPKDIKNNLYKITLIVLSIDMLISFSACIRLGMRHSGYPAKTLYEQLLDKYYSDERMRKSYTNMEDVK